MQLGQRVTVDDGQAGELGCGDRADVLIESERCPCRRGRGRGRGVGMPRLLLALHRRGSDDLMSTWVCKELLEFSAVLALDLGFLALAAARGQRERLEQPLRLLAFAELRGVLGY